jgi:4-diphosphocytidyl-2-C-methyl-D-erythritol kinase
MDPGAMLRTRAPAKVNLSLHVLGRRPDGYHDIESLVAFAGTGDTLAIVPGPGLSLVVEGPTAGIAGDPAENLVLKAARAFAQRSHGARLGAFRLVKRLPVAAGLGGGSSDAAAALRLLAQLNGVAIEHPTVMAAAQATGADVPVCVAGVARLMAGIGERLGPPLHVPTLFATLVNPGVPVSTTEVFRQLDLAPGQQLVREAHPTVGDALTRDALLSLLTRSRNDLEASAIGLAPAIAEALAAVRAMPGCRLARMSGSGATVFGLYDDCRAAAAATRRLRAAHPRWWIKPTRLR